MGSAMTAQCKCGYKRSVMIGGGVSNFMTTCLFPVLCTACNQLVQSNLLAERPVCPECGSDAIVPYDDRSLIKTAGSNQGASRKNPGEPNRQAILKNGHYYCPGCKKYTLTFRDSGLLWD
jgi:predicted RNA-binding Zn-ribbon protein involved in translation (DUF1610 family)